MCLSLSLSPNSVIANDVTPNLLLFLRQNNKTKSTIEADNSETCDQLVQIELSRNRSLRHTIYNQLI